MYFSLSISLSSYLILSPISPSLSSYLFLSLILYISLSSYLSLPISLSLSLSLRATSAERSEILNKWNLLLKGIGTALIATALALLNRN